MISRRQFLLAGAVTGISASLAGCSKFGLLEVPATVLYPGMTEGHLLRDAQALPPPSSEIQTDVVILGAGVAGLTAGWRLAKSGFKNFILLAGPELYGNAAGGIFHDTSGALPYPKGAHYLPLPSMESTHIREMLAEFGVIEANPYALEPTFDEAVLVHSPDERVFSRGAWEQGVLPQKGYPAHELAEQNRFFRYTDSLKEKRGADGKCIFCIPVALSSTDPEWTVLDQLTFKQWLFREGYTAPSLLTYLNYCCRDDFGASFESVSAWMGLHYFASRTGRAANATESAVLTWSNGLNPLAKYLAQHSADQLASGFAVKLSETSRGVTLLAARQQKGVWQTWTIKAKRAICAMPLHVASHVVENIGHYGFDPTTQMPQHAAWIISNFLMDAFPAEEAGAPLAWDNVIHGGKGLGYVVSTHQDIREAPPPQTVFSAYQVLSDTTPEAARAWLTHASADELYAQAICDLDPVYGRRLRQYAKSLEITVRGHAMATPTPGFLSNKGLQQLRTAQGKVLFAHSDLSGFSIFEEASWWGNRAALQILEEG